jgi:hypothetical protein
MDDAAVTTVLQRLSNTLNAAHLPSTFRASGNALARRLASPVRVTVLGQPKVGKSTLISALTDCGKVIDTAGLPTHEIGYADEPHVVATLNDGTRLTLDAIRIDEILATNPVFVQIFAPLEKLKHIRVLEVVTDGTPEEMIAATRWAAKRTDIAIWCSREFDQIERHIWSGFPDEKKGHGFLVLTQMDKMSAPAVSDRLNRMFDEGDAEFRIIAPVSAAQALSAKQGSGADPDRLIDASGLPALSDALFGQIELGRRADLDHATLFLERFEETTAPVAPKSGRRVTTLTSIVKRQPETAENGFGAAANYLRNQANEMLTDMVEFGEFAPQKIVERCLETANTLMDMIADEDAIDDQQDLAQDAATEAADLLLLMTLENTPGAAEDAIDLMLQVKRDFELAAAA